MHRPNFFILGAPKSGTTAMSTYLRWHPQIFIPRFDKEPHFFATDLHPYERARRLMEWKIQERAYYSLFHSAGESVRIGEASVFYLYSKEAAEGIVRNDPTAKLIAMLRRPDEMVYSLHREYRNSGIEPESSFERAWSRDETQLSLDPTERASAERFTYYTDVCNYAIQLRRYVDHFPPEQIKVIFFDQFAAQTAEVYAETLRFLGVTDSFRPSDFKPINASERPRSEAVAKWLLAEPGTASKAAARSVPAFVRSRLHDMVYHLNMRKFTRLPMKPTLRQRIVSRYQSQISELGELLKTDLSTWSA